MTKKISKKYKLGNQMLVDSIKLLVVIGILIIIFVLLLMHANYDQQKDADKFCQEHGHKKATDFIDPLGYDFSNVECDGNIYYTEVCFHPPPDKWGRRSDYATECKLMRRAD